MFEADLRPVTGHSGSLAIEGQLPSPGWYDDPVAFEKLRWWDGAKWTGNVRASTMQGAVGATAVDGRDSAGGGDHWQWTQSEAEIARWWKSLAPDTRNWIVANVRDQNDPVVARAVCELGPAWAPGFAHQASDEFNPIPDALFIYIRQRQYEIWQRRARRGFPI